MKKFITKEELPSVITDLINKYESNMRYHLSLDIRIASYGIVLRVRIQDEQEAYKTIYIQDYDIIDETLDAYDVEKKISDCVKAYEVELANNPAEEQKYDSVEIECA